MKKKEPEVDLTPVKPDSGLVPKRFAWSGMKKFQVKNTYWEELAKHETSIKIDYKILNKFFCTKESENKKKHLGDNGGLKGEVKQRVSVLDAKATQDVSIILSTYSLEVEETVEALTDCNEDMLDVETIQKLKNIKNNIVDSVEQAKCFTGDLNELSETERFVVCLVRIPLFDKRIDSIMFKYNFDAEFTMLSDNVSILKQSYESIKSNGKFQKLLRMVLDIGNFLNYKTAKGNALGFKLQSLKDMSMLKSKKIDGKKYSLLEFIIINLRDNAPEMLDFAKIFIPLDEAIKIDVDMLSSKFKEQEKYINNLEKDMTQANSFIKGLKESDEQTIGNLNRKEAIESCSSFIDNFVKFHSEADEIFNDLLKDFEEVRSNLITEGKKYGGNEDVGAIEVIEHIYKFAKEFNDALRNMVLQERINKKKLKYVVNTKGVKNVKINLDNNAEKPRKSSFKTLAQINQEIESSSQQKNRMPNTPGNGSTKKKGSFGKHDPMRVQGVSVPPTSNG